MIGGEWLTTKRQMNERRGEMEQVVPETNEPVVSADDHIGNAVSSEIALRQA